MHVLGRNTWTLNRIHQNHVHLRPPVTSNRSIRKKYICTIICVHCTYITVRFIMYILRIHLGSGTSMSEGGCRKKKYRTNSLQPTGCTGGVRVREFFACDPDRRDVIGGGRAASHRQMLPCTPYDNYRTM